MSAGGSSTSRSRHIQRPSGRCNRCGKLSRGRVRHDTCSAIATAFFGKDFVDQVKAMGIKQVLSAPRSPWQRAYIERVSGTIRRECLDHMIIFSERCLIATPQKLHRLLTSQPHTLGAGERQPGTPTDPAARRWTDHCDSESWWVASSL